MCCLFFNRCCDNRCGLNPNNCNGWSGCQVGWDNCCHWNNQNCCRNSCNNQSYYGYNALNNYGNQYWYDTNYIGRRYNFDIDRYISASYLHTPSYHVLLQDTNFSVPNA